MPVRFAKVPVAALRKLEIALLFLHFLALIQTLWLCSFAIEIRLWPAEKSKND